MVQLKIKREKSWSGMAVAMDCFVNDNLACKVKNGEEKECSIGNGIIRFKCCLPCNPMSEIITIDARSCSVINIVVKSGGWKPEISVLNPLLVMKDAKEQNKGIQKSKKIKFVPTKTVRSYFGINEVSRQWAICKGIIPSFSNAEVYDYDEIIDFELLEDGTSIVKGGLGGAIAGGVLLGGIGAVVGGITANRKAHQTCTNLSVKITVNRISAPTVYIELIRSNTLKSSTAYKKAFADAQEIVSLLQVVCNSTTNTHEETTAGFSSADEIRKYKQLLDDGIISKEEFENKKKQLLML